MASSAITSRHRVQRDSGPLEVGSCVGMERGTLLCRLRRRGHWPRCGLVASHIHRKRTWCICGECASNVLRQWDSCIIRPSAGSGPDIHRSVSLRAKTLRRTQQLRVRYSSGVAVGWITRLFSILNWGKSISMTQQPGLLDRTLAVANVKSTKRNSLRGRRVRYLEGGRLVGEADSLSSTQSRSTQPTAIRGGSYVDPHKNP